MKRLGVNQLLLLAVFVALVPVAVFSAVQGMLARQHAETLIGERLTSAAMLTATTQREPVAMAKRILGMLARQPEVAAARPPCDATLRGAIADPGMIINFARSDRNGTVQCSGMRFRPGTSFAGADWWEQARANPRFSLSLPMLGPISGRQVTVAAQPVFDAAGRFDGMVSAAIPLDWIRQSLDRARLSKRAIAAIADPRGRIVLASSPTTIRSVDVAAAFARVATVDDAYGRRWLYSAAPINDGDLHVVYAEPYSELSGFASDQFRTNLLLPVAALLLTAGAVWIGLQRLVLRWLDRLRVLAGRFARGDFAGDREAFAAAPLEIAAFASDLHAMADAIAERNAGLERAAEETRAMAREVNHRVKNNLQMILSLLGLQIARMTEPEARAAVDQTSRRIAALALVQRLAYDTGSRAEQGLVAMDQLLGELCGQLRASAVYGTGVALVCESDRIDEHIDRATPIALIAVECVTNALRHAFPVGRSGTITVRYEADGDGRSLSIVDDGIGFEATRPAGAGMGLDLIRGLARQLGTMPDVRPRPEGGTMVSVRYAAIGEPASSA